MASRIPQPRPNRPAQLPTSDTKSIQAWLEALNGPRLTLEELNRLTNGPFGDALAFLSEHLRGRHEIAAARHYLHLFQ
jgi:hypothetical protein